MRLFLLTILAGALVCSGATCASDSANFAAPITVTIEQLIKSPDDFNSKYVRVQGRITQCAAPQSCDICEETADGKLSNPLSCLGIELYEASVSPFDTWKKYRFTTVILEGKFNSTCLKASPPCLDNATALFETRVRAMLARHSVLDVKMEYVFGDLVAANGADRVDMIDAMNRAGLMAGASEQEAVFNLANIDHYFGSLAAGLAVGCIGNGRWPTQWGLGANSPGNPFRCWFLEKTATGWDVVLDETAP
jgi:hypothetical protein